MALAIAFVKEQGLRRLTTPDPLYNNYGKGRSCLHHSSYLWICTRPEGHSGLHRAHRRDGLEICCWDWDDQKVEYPDADLDTALDVVRFYVGRLDE